MGTERVRGLCRALTAIVALGIVYVMLPIGLETFFRYRLRKPLHCPVTGEEGWVLLDARRAGVSAAFGRSCLRVKSCSLWPARDACGRECLNLPGWETQDLPGREAA